MAKSLRNKLQQKAPEKEFFEEVLEIARVTRVVAGGRRMRFRVSVAVGNKNGLIGFGVGKAGEVITAIKKAVHEAKRSMMKVSIVDGTIVHPIHYKFKSAKILLMPAGEGTGIIAGGAIRKILELSGVSNVLSKSLGTSNPIALAQTTLQALQAIEKSAQRYGIRKKGAEAKADKVEANNA